jgi:hypothetical protein
MNEQTLVEKKRNRPPEGGWRHEKSAPLPRCSPAAFFSAATRQMRQRYFAKIGLSSAMVFFGQNFLSVRKAFFKAECAFQSG